ncbi:MAG: hypothetical protein J5706_05420, partial [Elusimicrobiales bacterium]|nr:hypothetical protein [Elusimicrobiales bacterium]
KKYSDEQIDYLLDIVNTFKNPNALHWYESLFYEKERRIKNDVIKKTSIDWYALILNDLYIDNSMVEKAYAFQAEYPYIDFPKLPDRLVYSKKMGKKGWRVFDLSKDGREATVVSSGFDKGKHIVMSISWDCSFADAAIEAIMTTPKLKKIFLEFGSIVGTKFDIKSQKIWKNQLNMDRIYCRFSKGEIPQIATDLSPHFFFLKDGKVIYEFSSVFSDEPSMGLLSRFDKGMKLISEETDNNKIFYKNRKENAFSKSTSENRLSPFFVIYKNLLDRAWDMHTLLFINRVNIVNGCIRTTSISALAQNVPTSEFERNLDNILFCQKNNDKHLFSLAKTLEGVSVPHKIEFARSIITKDGHIISAYLGGIEKDLGKAKAKEIAAKLAGHEPQFDTVCEIAENKDTGAKTLSPVSKKGYFCVIDK